MLAWLNLKPSGIKRSQAFFVFLTRISRNRLFSLKGFLNFSILVFLSCYTISRHERDHPFTNTLKNISVDIAAPFFYVQNYLVQCKESLSQNLQTHAALLKEIEDLHKQINDFKLKNAHADYLSRENEHLKQILAITPDVTRPTKRLKVLGIPFDRFRSHMIIANRTHDDLYKDQAVLTPEGIIGRIQDVGGHATRVMLLTDAQSRIPVRVEQTGDQAILAGQNTQDLIVLHMNRPVDSPNRSIQIGDRLLTSGLGGIFPPDLPVAIVSSVENNTITARMIVAAHTARYVNIVDDRVVIPKTTDPMTKSTS